MGWIVTIVIGGIVGSALGFWLAGLVGLSATNAIAGYAISIVGAAVLIFVLKALGIFK
jgi:uncharacterized membrane protein YeaQ/YmgE (transglycosylase-associated protein family)